MAGRPIKHNVLFQEQSTALHDEGSVVQANKVEDFEHTSTALPQEDKTLEKAQHAYGPTMTANSVHTEERKGLSESEDDISVVGHRQSELGLQRDQSTDDFQSFSLRESSSTFLASLTSASELSSPLTSQFPSSDSLKSSQAGKDADRSGSIDTSTSYHRRNMNETLTQAVLPISPANLASSITEPSSEQHLESEASTTRDSLNNNIYMDPGRYDHDDAEEDEYEKPEMATRGYRNTQGHGPGTSNNSFSRLHEERGVSISPSMFSSRTKASYTVESSDRTPTQSTDSYFLGPVNENREEHIEESHSQTPLLHHTDMPVPKETDLLVKDSSVLGNKLINQYEVIKRLGSGTHGTVKLARDISNNQKVAIKVVRRYPKKGRLGRQEKPEDKVKKEVAVLKKARHPHVVSLLEVIDDIRYEKVYLILEYVERGEINWRKETERDIAIFELNRIRREIAGSVDDEAETEALAYINGILLQHHSEIVGPHFHETAAARDYNPIPHTSLSTAQDQFRASANTNEHDTLLAPNHSSSQPSSRPPSRSASEHGEVLSLVEETLRVPSRASRSGIQSTLENEMSGSMYGSYVEDDAFTHASETEHGIAFDDFADTSGWTLHEEEYRYVPCLTLSEARDVFRDTVLGLEYLHFHGIIHRDIKPANLLWTREYRVKISDFGVSYLGRQMDGEGNDGSDEPTISHADMSIELAKTVGTPAFYAPELCDPDLFDAQRNVTRPHITGQIDVWALGVTLYAMIYGRLPFYDVNEFAMYEKIAKHEVFIPSKRLRGVEDKPTVSINSNKREDHIVQYEHIEDELKDLLKRLLIKDPSKRITIKEVKHHPWVLRGLDNQNNWIDKTDPSFEGTRKIEVSQEDVQTAMVPRGLIEGLKSGIKRLTSVVRGRGDSRKRAESNIKVSSANTSTSPRASAADRDRHRLSLHGDESIFSALRASRENTEHPLSQSTLASPIHDRIPEEFVTPISYVESSTNTSPTPMFGRPSVNSRTTSTAESIITLKPTSQLEADMTSAALSGNGIGRNSAGSSSSSISKIIDGTKEATRRLASRVRSREPGKFSHDDSGSSRTSSADNLSSTVDFHHVQPMVGVSPLIASGHLHHPMMLTSTNPKEQTPAHSPEPTRDSSHDSLHGSLAERGRTTQARSRANTTEQMPHYAQGSFTSSMSQAEQHRLSSSGSSEGHNTSTWSEPFSRLSSNASGASILTSPLASPSGIEQPVEDSTNANSLLATGETITPALMRKYRTQQQRDANSQVDASQNDEADLAEEGSDDEGI
ncbi:MAG: hypothetical protein LQ340_004108, partial [Diploschistes diacapsis]